jgi:hypothetical protein
METQEDIRESVAKSERVLEGSVLLLTIPRNEQIIPCNSRRRYLKDKVWWGWVNNMRNYT